MKDTSRLILLLSIILGCPSYSLATDSQLSPNKVIALVQSESCDGAAVDQELMDMGHMLAADGATSWVAVNLGAGLTEEGSSVDDMPTYIAVIEVLAPEPELIRIAEDMKSSLTQPCKSDIYLVHERRNAFPARTWGIGTPSPGSKSFVTLFPKKGTTREYFNTRWVAHVPIVLGKDWRERDHGSRLYVHNVVVDMITEGSPDYAGIGEGSKTTRFERLSKIWRTVHDIWDAYGFMDMKNFEVFSVQEIILKD